ncbi:general transcription factor 3C polypeptide 2 [Trichinella spiralis]|uniref:general transcription factor 3C polypeptide 2 n=1 Tax=Trichinella spiralis TaxID=6334 RepID=UPI0001EFD4FE|nr:general transcription factor 3C polypeptide 2 [Trichinella spiralis]
MAVVFFTVLLIPRCHSKQRRLSQLVVFDFVFSVGWLMNPDISMMYSSPSLNMVSTDSLTLNGSPMLGNTMDSLHVVTSCLGPVAQSAPAFPVAPGAEHSAQKQQQQQQQQQQQHHQQQQNQQPFIGSGTVEQNRKIVMDYEADFPKLATSTNAPGTTLSALATTPAIRSTTVTQIFQLPYEERKFRVKQDNQYGSNERNSEQIECNDIMQKTDASASDKLVFHFLLLRREISLPTHDDLVPRATGAFDTVKAFLMVKVTTVCECTAKGIFPCETRYLISDVFHNYHQLGKQHRWKEYCTSASDRKAHIRGILCGIFKTRKLK